MRTICYVDVYFPFSWTSTEGGSCGGGEIVDSTLGLKFQKLQKRFPEQMHYLTFPPVTTESSHVCASLSTLVIFFLIIAILVSVK